MVQPLYITEHIVFNPITKMKITLEFSTGQDLDCRLLESAMTAMSRCLVNRFDEEATDEAEAETEEEKPQEEPVGASAPNEAEPEVKKPRARKSRKATTEKTEEAVESTTLSAQPTADPDGQTEAVTEESAPAEQTQTDLPFAEAEEPIKPAPVAAAAQTVTTMTAQDFRQALEALRVKLGVERDSAESSMLAKEISARCNMLYGTPKPSTLPGEKLAEFVTKEMNGLEWNADHTGFEDKVPF